MVEVELEGVWRTREGRKTVELELREVLPRVRRLSFRVKFEAWRSRFAERRVGT